MSGGRVGAGRAVTVVVVVVSVVLAGLGVGGYLLLTRVLPVPWKAERNAQLAADRVAPGRLRVFSSSFEFNEASLGNYMVRARLLDDPDAEVTWWMDGTHCDAGTRCEAGILAALPVARQQAVRARALLGSSAGCPVVGLSRGGASVEVAIPRAEIPTAAARLDGCLRAWGAAGAGPGPGPGPGLEGQTIGIYLVDPGAVATTCTDPAPARESDSGVTSDPDAARDPDWPLVGRLDAALSTNGRCHSVAVGQLDPAGRPVGSTAATLSPLPPDAAAAVHRNQVVAAHARDWLAGQGMPAVLAPGLMTSSFGLTRYLPGRGDRIRTCVPLPGDPIDTAGRIHLQAVALSVDLDGGDPRDVRLVDVVEQGAGLVPQDPDIPAG